MPNKKKQHENPAPATAATTTAADVPHAAPAVVPPPQPVQAPPAPAAPAPEAAALDIELLGPQPDASVAPTDSISLADIQTTAADLDDFQETEVEEPNLPVLHKPDPDKKFWACPHPGYHGNFKILEVDPESGFEKTRYLLTARGLAHVPVDRVKLVYLILCRYHGDDGGFFLLKAGGLTHNADPDRWTKSAHKCIKAAKQGPIRMYTKKAGGRQQQGYFHSVVRKDKLVNYPPPIWPVPETKPFLEFLKLAFEGRIIDGPDHPVLVMFQDEQPQAE